MALRIFKRSLLFGVIALALPAAAQAATVPYPTPAPTRTSVLVPFPGSPSPAPSVTGTAQVGGTLTGSRGSWPDDPPSSQWLRCNVAANTCETTGDTDTQYSPTAADVGLQIKLRVVGTHSQLLPPGSSTRTVDALSNTIAAAPAQASAPTNVVAPKITGDAREGQLLTAALGQWTGTDPISYTYAWATCGKGKPCTAAGTGATYRVKAADVGKGILLLVTGRNSAGSTGAFATSSLVTARGAGLKRLSPFPTLLVDGRVAGRSTQITTLRLRRVAGGATINATCKGRGCPFRKSTVRVRKGKSRTVALPKLQRRMPAGTTVVITVRKGNTLGKYIRLRFRRGFAPARVDRCVAPKSSKPLKCP